MGEEKFLTICCSRSAYHRLQKCGHVIEALASDSMPIIVNATFIIGKFTATTTAKMELEDTITLITELGIPIEIIQPTDQSYKGIQQLLEEAQQKEKQLEAHTLKEVEKTLKRIKTTS